MYFEMIFFVVEAIRERCASFMIITATDSEICGGHWTDKYIYIDWIHYNNNNNNTVYLFHAISPNARST